MNGLLNEDDSFLRVCVDTLRTQHKLLSFLSPPLAGAVVFHRPERVVCIYAHILCSLGVCSLFYGKDPNSIPKKISKAVITSVSNSKSNCRLTFLFLLFLSKLLHCLFITYTPSISKTTPNKSFFFNPIKYIF